MRVISTVPAPYSHQPHVAGLCAVVIAANLAAWAWAVLLFHNQPILLGTALLAYGFGLRHAVDADHIASIDNVIRKLMQNGEPAERVGFFFALGHSTVVLLAVAAASTIAAWPGLAGALKTVVGPIGTLVSAFFLFAVAAANVVILRGLWRAVRRGGAVPGANDGQHRGGLVTRLCQPVFRLVTRSWHMVPLGFLFGIGFETATEVALLGLSATEAARGATVWSVLVFPALFASGMALVDTADGILMVRAYDWACKVPGRTLQYNLVITGVSVLVAVLIGSIELLGVISEGFGLEGGGWRLVQLLDDNLNALGLAIIGVFVTAWIIAAAINRRDVRPGLAQPASQGAQA